MLSISEVVLLIVAIQLDSTSSCVAINGSLQCNHHHHHFWLALQECVAPLVACSLQSSCFWSEPHWLLQSLLDCTT